MPLPIKDFTIDGHNMRSVDKFWDEVQRVLCPDFKYFGKNLDALVDILRGGSGAFEQGETIRLRLIHQNYAEKHLQASFIRKMLRIIEKSPNLEIVE
ncbi:MAG: barstar family protein [Candidatus Thorarchaeota archaeon]